MRYKLRNRNLCEPARESPRRQERIAWRHVRLSDYPVDHRVVVIRHRLQVTATQCGPRRVVCVPTAYLIAIVSVRVRTAARRSRETLRRYRRALKVAMYICPSYPSYKSII